jgi:capsule assembly protein Wzi
MRLLLAAILIGLAPPSLARGDTGCPEVSEVAVDGLGTPLADFMRVAEISGAAPSSSRLIVRGGARTEPLCDPSSIPVPAFVRLGAPASLRAVPLRLTTAWNSRYPSGENDGLLWAGRGVSQLASAGVAYRWGALSLALAPEVTWSENRFFDTVPNGRSGAQRFGNAFYLDNIDLPQRFGAGPWAAWAPGQSYVRVDHWNVALGLSSENLWIGPGIRNSILMSNAGPGFPHVFLGTSRPADIWIGNAEALLFWGRLERTPYVAGGGRPLISGLAVTYEPRWIPRLYVGLGRYFVQPWGGLTLREYLAVFQTFEKKSLAGAFKGGDNPHDNQLASVFWRWVFPEVGLEIYGEWAREDYNWSWWSTIREPDRSQAYLLGLQKTFRAGSRLVRVHAELVDLQEMAGFGSAAGAPVYYVHSGDLGYTNRGQLIGAWIGPGGDSQTLAVDVFHAGGRIGGYLERVRRNDEYYWAVVEPAVGNFSHDAEITAGVRQALTVGPVEVSWEAAASYRWNRDFIRHEPNFKLVLGLSLPTGSPAARSP